MLIASINLNRSNIMTKKLYIAFLVGLLLVSLALGISDMNKTEDIQTSANSVYAINENRLPN